MYCLFQAVNNHCFPAFLNIPPAQFKLVLDSIIWAFKHTMRNVADTGLQILYQMLQNVEQHEAAAQSFYQTYFTDILQHIFSVVTDTSHTAGKCFCGGCTYHDMHLPRATSSAWVFGQPHSCLLFFTTVWGV